MIKLVRIVRANRKLAHLNHKKAKRIAKLNRLKRKSMLPATDKKSLRQAAELAYIESKRTC